MTLIGSPYITLGDVVIALYIATGVAAIGWGILGGLATRVGGIRKLFRLTVIEANKETTRQN